MNDKLTAWEERISMPPEATEDYDEFLDLLIECRIVEQK